MEREGGREWSTIEGKGEVDRERKRSGMGGSWVRSPLCFRRRDLASGWVRSHRCWGATRPVWSGVVCGGAIWGCVRNLAGSTLSSQFGVRFFFFFFFWKWFEGKLGDGFWTVGRHDLGWLELGWGELGYGFWTVWGVCSSSFSLFKHGFWKLFEVKIKPENILHPWALIL